jgi:hypothetical protein
MLKRLLLSINTVIALTISHQAISITFDFATIANSGEYGAETITVNDASGVSVIASGFNSSDNSVTYNAYLDSSWFHSGAGAPGGNGGLGVCKKLNAMDQCRPSSDDNVGSYESLRLLFNQVVTIDQLVFRNGNHGEDFLGQFSVATDAEPATSYDLTHIFDTPLTGTEFIFTNINSATWPGLSRHGNKHKWDRHNRRRGHWSRHGDEENDEDGHGYGHKFNFREEYKYEFYISSMEVTAVPVPAAVWLFASGLLALAGVARKRI